MYKILSKKNVIKDSFLHFFMRIGVNTRLFVKGKMDGIAWFTYEIFKRIVTQHPEHEFIFFFDRPYDSDFIFAPNVKPAVVHPQARHPLLWYLFF